MPAIKTCSISFSYNETPILKDFSIRLPKGAFCALLGANGIGKSTLIKILSQLESPQVGDVSVNGRIGYVPQEVQLGLPISVLEMVLLGRISHLTLFKAPSKVDYEAANLAIKRVGVAHLADRLFSSLSGGERQLVLMARALVTQADILILDEPTAAMDWHNQGLILNMLHSLVDEGKTVLMSTHSPQHAFDFSSHALLLFGQEDYVFGAPEEVLTESALSRLYKIPIKRIGHPWKADKSAVYPLLSQI